MYGQTIDADGIFLVMDRSASMQDSGELQIMKREAIKLTLYFSPDVQFGIIFFDSGIQKFPASEQPARADDPGTVLSARAFTLSVSGGHGTCPHAALDEAIQFAGASTASKDVVIYISDGGGTCPGSEEAQYLAATLKEVAQANAGKAIINTIGVLDIPPLNEKFLKDLAGQNGGTYTRITR